MRLNTEEYSGEWVTVIWLLALPYAVVTKAATAIQSAAVPYL
jgi:hypothetical protein